MRQTTKCWFLISYSKLNAPVAIVWESLLNSLFRPQKGGRASLQVARGEPVNQRCTSSSEKLTALRHPEHVVDLG